MIRCEVTASGVIAKGATKRSREDGSPCLSFEMTINLPDKGGLRVPLSIVVMTDPACPDGPRLVAGTRVTVDGSLSVAKRGGMDCLGLTALAVNVDSPAAEDDVVGQIAVQGRIGREVVERQDKRGNPYIVFSGYSSTKNGAGYEYTWVRFVGFGLKKASWMVPKADFDAIGDLELSVYNGGPSLSCRATKVSKREASSSGARRQSSGSNYQRKPAAPSKTPPSPSVNEPIPQPDDSEELPF